MGKLIFGTDGIRTIYGNFPLDDESLFNFGRSLVEKFNTKKELNILIGRDTRLSGKLIESELVKGLSDNNVKIILLGIVPTPVVSFLTKKLKADLGIVITASHNPPQYNGLKFFNSEGYKLSNEEELEIEEIFFSKSFSNSQNKSIIQEKFNLKNDYVEFVKSFSMNLSGLRIVIDCANGAAYKIAPKVFSELGAEVITLYSGPDGTNINQSCGALFPEKIQNSVLKYKADLGICFDGDADRLIMCDEKGNLLDGDKILAIIAKDFHNSKKLINSTLVTTVMSNNGLHKYIQGLGLKILLTEIGDHNVIKMMQENNCLLGGEQSGHVIVRPYTTTGDGIISALQILNIVKKNNKPLSYFSEPVELFPQVLVNVEVKNKIPFKEIPNFLNLKDSIEKKINCRIFIRYSGTENKLRIMLEGNNQKEINYYAEKLANHVKNNI